MENSLRREPYLYFFIEHLGGGLGDVYKGNHLFGESELKAIKVLRNDMNIVGQKYNEK
ncbi:hypothetical protein ACFWMS_22175 [Peribacillus butanolivorans]|uniref:hypothetical protein n=1 Tax=Peribacillus butanolivorans TaxID=421767 RepID=UPI00364BB3E7